MIDAVSISTVTPPPVFRGNAQRTVSSEAPSRVDTVEPILSSRIRVDNFLDLAILEVRSQETGDVIRQFPTEFQIRAFQRASELEQKSSDNRLEQARQARAEIFTQNTDTNQPTNINNGGNTSTEQTTAPQQQSTTPQQTTAPQQPVSTSATYTPAAQSSGESTPVRSIVV